MPVAAYKRKFPYADPLAYACMLKRHFMLCEPRFWVVLSKCKIITPDGPMVAIKYSDEIDLPDADPISECQINGQTLFLWDEYCWVPAIDKQGRCTRTRTLEPCLLQPERQGTMIIYKLTDTKVEL